AAVEPAAAHDVCGGFRPRPIAGHKAFSLIADFADLSGRQVFAVRPDDFGPCAEHWSSARQQFFALMVLEGEAGERPRGLGQTVDLTELAPENFNAALEKIEGDRYGAQDDA